MAKFGSEGVGLQCQQWCQQLAVEHIGGLFFPFFIHGWTGQKWEFNEGLLAWLCGKCYSKLVYVMNVKVDTVESITLVDFHQLDMIQGWVDKYNLTEDTVKGMAKFYDSRAAGYDQVK